MIKKFNCEECQDQDDECQTCCPHDDRDHGICFQCEHDNNDSLIDAAEYAIGDR